MERKNKRVTTLGALTFIKIILTVKKVSSSKDFSRRARLSKNKESSMEDREPIRQDDNSQ